MKNYGLLYFHQGWTDIINSLALINYYEHKYNKIYLLIREDAKPMVDYFINNKKKVIPIYLPKEKLDRHDYTNKIIFLSVHLLHSLPYHILFHGGLDVLRNDIYANRFNFYHKTDPDFVKLFYTSYDIDYKTRYEYFDFDRDKKKEELMYDEFINTYGKDYILYHHVYDKLDDKFKNIKLINLDSKTNVFFDYIKILENSLELHLLDSVWGALVYLLNKKYNLFSDKKVYIYCKRGYNLIFKDISINFELINQ
jgi:hypothetical protein